MLGGGGGGGRWWVRGGYSKRISLNKNPNVNKKCGGGECGEGAGEVGAGESFFYMNPNLK